MDNIADVDERILKDPIHLEHPTGDFYMHATGYLANWLHNERGFKDAWLHGKAVALLGYLEAPKEERNPEAAEGAMLDLHLFGTVGSMLFRLGGKPSPQMRKEIDRFANNQNELVSNFFLFYLADRLAGMGHQVDFVPEAGRQGTKTPDLQAEKNGHRVFLEANAKQPTIEVDTPERLWRLIESLVGEKKQKFCEAAFQPGMIVADISPARYQLNESGGPPFLELRKDLVEDIPGGGFYYHLYNDPDWKQRAGNDGNVFSYLVEQFLAIDRTRYGVQQCLVTVTRRVLRNAGSLLFPKYHLLLVDRSAKDQAVLDLGRHVFLV